MHIAVLVWCGKSWWKSLLTALHTTQMLCYVLLVNGSLCVLIYMGVKQYTSEAMQILLYTLLCLDCFQHTFFSILLWRRLEYVSEGAQDTVVVDRQAVRRWFLVLLYPTMLTIASMFRRPYSNRHCNDVLFDSHDLASEPLDMANAIYIFECDVLDSSSSLLLRLYMVCYQCARIYPLPWRVSDRQFLHRLSVQ